VLKVPVVLKKSELPPVAMFSVPEVLLKSAFRPKGSAISGSPMASAEERNLSCPYCGEQVEISVEETGPASEQYVEDCPICCRPWDVRVSRGTEGESDVVLLRNDD